MAARNTGVNKINMVPALRETCHPVGKANIEYKIAGMIDGIKGKYMVFMHIKLWKWQDRYPKGSDYFSIKLKDK